MLSNKKITFIITSYVQKVENARYGESDSQSNDPIPPMHTHRKKEEKGKTVENKDGASS